jgi:lysophospholipase L1-like esterase
VRTIPRPGARARYVAVKAAYGGGGFAGTLAVLYALLATEAKLARKTIGRPTAHAPRAAGSYGRGRPGNRPLHLTVIGDSSAAGLGCAAAEQTPGALLAGGMARDLGVRVDLDVVAFTGARSASLEVQVASALRRPVDVAVIVIGANDVTHRVPIASAARDLARAVATLRQAGAQVVVGTCPDLGTVKPVMQPLRTVAAWWSRRLAAAQTVATVDAGGISVSSATCWRRTSAPSRTCGATTASTRPRTATGRWPTRCCRACWRARSADPGQRADQRQRPGRAAGRQGGRPRAGVEVDPLPGAEGTGRPGPAAAPAAAGRPRRSRSADRSGRAAAAESGAAR